MSAFGRKEDGQLGLGTISRNVDRVPCSPASVSSPPVDIAGAARGRQRVRVVGTPRAARPATRPQRRPRCRRSHNHQLVAGDITLALHEDGSVSAFGQNDYGQLGLGDVGRSSPTRCVAGVRQLVARWISRWRCEDGSVSLARAGMCSSALATTDRNSPTRPSLAGVRQLVMVDSHAGAARTAACPRLVNRFDGGLDRPQRADQGAVARRRPSARRRWISRWRCTRTAACGRWVVWAARPWRHDRPQRRPRCRRSPASVSSSPCRMLRRRRARRARLHSSMPRRAR